MKARFRLPTVEAADQEIEESGQQGLGQEQRGGEHQAFAGTIEHMRRTEAADQHAIFALGEHQLETEREREQERYRPPGREAGKTGFHGPIHRGFALFFF